MSRSRASIFACAASLCSAVPTVGFVLYAVLGLIMCLLFGYVGGSVSFTLGYLVLDRKGSTYPLRVADTPLFRAFIIREAIKD